MFLLLALPPALLAAALLGGKLSRVFDYPWRAVWLIWLSLGVQIPLFLPVAEPLGRDLIGWIHIGTYVPILVFLGINRGAGLGLVLAGALANLTAITANRGAMPVDPRAWESAFPGTPPSEGDRANTVVTGEHRLQILGDVMALPPDLPMTNAFSIGDLLLALGLAYCFCRLSLGAPPLDRASLGAFIAGSDRRPPARAGWAGILDHAGLCLAGAALAALAVILGAVGGAALRLGEAVGLGEAGLVGMLATLVAGAFLGLVTGWSLGRAGAPAAGGTAVALLAAAAALGLLAAADLPTTAVAAAGVLGMAAGIGVAAVAREIADAAPGAGRAAVVLAGLAVAVGAVIGTGMPQNAAAVASGAQALAVAGVGVVATILLGAGLGRRALDA